MHFTHTHKHTHTHIYTRAINKMKNGKASGVDGISAEIMKFLIRDEEIKKYAVKCFNNAIREKINEDWLISKTKMLPKNKRPKILEFRQIALTVNSSKILCSIMREKIEEQDLRKLNIVSKI